MICLLIMKQYTQYKGDYCFDKRSQSSVSSVVRLPRTHEAVMYSNNSKALSNVTTTTIEHRNIPWFNCPRSGSRENVASHDGRYGNKPFFFLRQQQRFNSDNRVTS